MFVYEMPMSFQLHAVYLDAEADVGLGAVDLVLPDSLVALGFADLLQWGKCSARRRADDAERLYGPN